MIYYLLIIIILLFILYNNKNFIYNNIIKIFLIFKKIQNNKYSIYLHNNFDTIFKNYNIEYINSNNFYNNYQINSSRNSINQYKIINLYKYYDLVTNIINNNNINQNIYNLLTEILLHININDKKINIDDCIILDLITVSGQPFTTIHTDIEWNLFNNSDGFQVWYLYNNNNIFGNMFLFDTDIVKPYSYLLYNNKNIVQHDQCSQQIINTYNYDNINLKIKYLNMTNGECLIFGKNLYHMSDYKNSKYRHAINFRVIIKDSDGCIHINLNNKSCYYNNIQFKIKLFKNNIKVINNKIYPKMFDLINLI
jgi:hypothetical protein